MGSPPEGRPQPKRLGVSKVLKCPRFQKRRRCQFDWKVDRASLLRFQDCLQPFHTGELTDARLRDFTLNLCAGATATAPAKTHKAAGLLKCSSFKAEALWKKLGPLYASTACCSMNTRVGWVT